MEDFNLPSRERSERLQRLQDAIGNVPPYFWALCQVCDFSALDKMIQIAQISPTIVRVAASQARTVVLHWTQNSSAASRSSTPKTTPVKQGSGSSPAISPLAKRQKITGSPATTTTTSPSTSPLLVRSKAATAIAKERDDYLCVLTKDSIVEVAHIYPFCQLRGIESDTCGLRHLFWDNLRTFWSEEKVAAWEAQLFPRGLSLTGIESVDNRITLSRNAHCAWNRGAFALKPISISADKTQLKVQFFWQKKLPNTETSISLCTIPPSTENLDLNEGAFDYGPAKLFNTEEQRIKSGDIFDLTTDDAVKKPLPSFELLELQWFLTRVVGMAGAAEPYEPDSGDYSDDQWFLPRVVGMAGAAEPYEPNSGDYSDDDDVPCLDLDEVGDVSLISDIPEPALAEGRQGINTNLAEKAERYGDEAEGDRIVMVD